jgi:hypothetical protein
MFGVQKPPRDYTPNTKIEDQLGVGMMLLLSSRMSICGSISLCTPDT